MEVKSEAFPQCAAGACLLHASFMPPSLAFLVEFSEWKLQAAPSWRGDVVLLGTVGTSHCISACASCRRSLRPVAAGRAGTRLAAPI